jgi:pimeloyl-ACP methyl ester carboxylesterase
MIPRAAQVPMAVSVDKEPGETPRLAIVCLPGRGNRMDVYERNGFIDDVRAAGIRADFYQVDAHLGYYINVTLAERMREDVFSKIDGNYDEVWVVGASLGALGAVLLEAESPGTWQRMLLLGPFVGNEKKFFTAAGLSPKRTTELPEDLDPEHLRLFWNWIIAWDNDAEVKPQIFASWGDSDRFARYQQLLTHYLPDDATHVTAGGHNWSTWKSGWRKWLEHADWKN